jgi:hypothetical protein
VTGGQERDISGQLSQVGKRGARAGPCLLSDSGGKSPHHSPIAAAMTRPQRHDAEPVAMGRVRGHATGEMSVPIKAEASGRGASRLLITRSRTVTARCIGSGGKIGPSCCSSCAPGNSHSRTTASARGSTGLNRSAMTHLERRGAFTTLLPRVALVQSQWPKLNGTN